MTPDEIARKKPRTAARASILVPVSAAERRRAITALYAFCREVDDAVEKPSDLRSRARPWTWWRARSRALLPATAASVDARARPGDRTFRIVRARLESHGRAWR